MSIVAAVEQQLSGPWVLIGSLASIYNSQSAESLGQYNNYVRDRRSVWAIFKSAIDGASRPLADAFGNGYSNGESLIYSFFGDSRLVSLYERSSNDTCTVAGLSSCVFGYENVTDQITGLPTSNWTIEIPNLDPRTRPVSPAIDASRSFS